MARDPTRYNHAQADGCVAGIAISSDNAERQGGGTAGRRASDSNYGEESHSARAATNAALNAAHVFSLASLLFSEEDETPRKGLETLPNTS